MGGETAKGIRARALVAAFALLVPAAYLNTAQPVDAMFSLLVAPVAILLALVAFNALLRLVFRRPPFSQTDLIVVFSIVAVGAAAAGEWSWIGHSAIHGFALHADDNPTIRDQLLPYFPNWLIVKDAALVQDMVGGGKDLAYTWGKLPVFLPRYLAWGALFGLMGGAMLCINSLMREAWCERERLAFPLVQLPIAAAEGGGFGAMWRSRPMWIAFAVMFSIDMLNGLNYLFPNVPALPVKEFVDLQSLFAEPPWSNIGQFPIGLYPFLAAVGLFIPSDLLFSLILFFLLRKITHVALASNGIPQATFSGTQIMPGPPYFDEQTWGGILALFVGTLWFSRGYLRELVAAIRTNAPAEEGGLKHRWAFLGMLACIAGMAWFGVQGGLPVPYLVLYLALFLIFGFVLTRMRAQLGPPTHEFAFFGPTSFMSRFFGTAWINPRQAAWLSQGFLWMNRVHRTHVMPYQLEGMKMTGDEGVKQRSVFWALGLATVAGFVLAQFFLHAESYRTGNTYPYAEGEAYVRSLTAAPHGPDLTGIGMTVFGFSMVFGMDVLRFRIPGFPVHPAGYVLSMNFGVDYYWFGLLIALGVKGFTQRYYGLRGYDKLRNVALGILVAEYAAEAIWTTVALVTHQSTYTISFNDRTLSLP